MHAFLTQETPGKVISCAGAAVVSMAVLFAVTVSDASFQGGRNTLPDPFAPAKVITVIDHVSQAYARALSNFTQPARIAVAIHLEQLDWIGQQVFASPQRPAPKPASVAGAFIIAGKAEEAVIRDTGSYGSISVDSLYNLLIGE